ncbi:hypothetical protein SD70_31620, partial [Gordoniibacillus kamchatkensis]
MIAASFWKTLLALLSWAAAGALAVQYGGYAAWFVFDALTAAFAIGLAVRLGALHRIEVWHELSAARLLEGEEQTVAVRLHHRSFVPVPWLLLEEHWKRTGEATSRTYRKLLFPWFRKTLEYRYTLTGLPRGEYRLVRVVAAAGDGIGWLPERRKVAVLAGRPQAGMLPEGGGRRGGVVAGSAAHAGHGANPALGAGVGPAFVAYPRETPLRIGVGYGTDEEGRPLPGARTPAGGGVLAALRDYAAGDPLGRMHWKATARRGKLTVKAPEPHEQQQVLLLLDTSAATYAALAGAGPEALEASVRAAAGLLRACSERGLALALACCDGGAPVAAGSGPRGRELLLERAGAHRRQRRRALAT